MGGKKTNSIGISVNGRGITLKHTWPTHAAVTNDVAAIFRADDDGPPGNR